MGRRIVIVEDEQLIAESIAARLQSEGFECSLALDGPTGVELCERLDPDLVILDLMLPGFDGMEVCRRIQTSSHVAVLMLTARASETDVVAGLGFGADDYMTKPFSQRELVARVHALLRRVERGQPSGAEGARTKDAIIRIGEIEIDPAARLVSSAEEAVDLTPTEFDLLCHLARSPGVVFSRERLLVEVWGYADPAGERTVDSHVAGLRRKLGPDVVRTARGAGYAVPRGPAG